MGLDDAPARQLASFMVWVPPADAEVDISAGGLPGRFRAALELEEDAIPRRQCVVASITSMMLPQAVQGSPSQEISTIVTWSRRERFQALGGELNSVARFFRPEHRASVLGGRRSAARRIAAVSVSCCLA